MLDFSFIIPVYNAENTIQRCLDSIRIQKIENYEVLLMDDGSDDNSYSICMKYQQMDSRFKVYHQKNSGPSVARNRCLDIAAGRWICFVDSDDTIEENFLNEAYNLIIENNLSDSFIFHDLFVEEFVASVTNSGEEKLIINQLLQNKLNGIKKKLISYNMFTVHKKIIFMK